MAPVAPQAVVVAPSDLPWPPAELFDQPPGALYIVQHRDGWLSSPLALAAAEEAVERLGVRTIVVLGYLSPARAELLSGDELPFGVAAEGSPAERYARCLTADVTAAARASALLRGVELELAAAVCDDAGRVSFGPALRLPTEAGPAVGLEAVRRLVVSVEAGGNADRRSGAGLLLDAAAGIVVTLQHVTRGRQPLWVILLDGERLPAEPVGEDLGADLAVLRIAPRAGPAPVLGRAAPLLLGERVYAIGHPFDRFPHSVSAGVVSALGRRFETEGRTYQGLIQTDAAMNRGNSGGPLCDAAGRVIGLCVAIYSTTQASVGIGFALPIEQVQAAAAAIVAHGEVGWLGALAVDLTPATAVELRRVEPGGVLVQSVVPGGPAGGAGLQAFDVIERVGDRPLGSVAELQRAIWAARPGERLELTLWRAGERHELAVVVGRRPAEVSGGL